MKRLFLDILRMIFHNEFERGGRNFYKQRKQLWKHQHLNVSRFWINVQNVFIFWIHFFLSVQRTVIAQMIPVSITYQFCKNKFVSKMIIYVNFNFVIMLTIIMMIMIFVFYTATYFLRQEFVLRMSYRNGRRSLPVKSKALTKSLSLYFSESTWRKQSLHNLTIFRK